MDLIKFLENSSYEEFKEWIKDRTINKSFKYDDDSLIKIIAVNKSKNNEKNYYNGTVLLKNSDGYEYVYNILSEDVVDLCGDSRYTLKSHHTIIKLYIKHSTPAIKLFTDDIQFIIYNNIYDLIEDIDTNDILKHYFDNFLIMPNGINLIDFFKNCSYNTFKKWCKYVSIDNYIPEDDEETKIMIITPIDYEGEYSYSLLERNSIKELYQYMKEVANDIILSKDEDFSIPSDSFDIIIRKNSKLFFYKDHNDIINIEAEELTAFKYLITELMEEK